MQGELVTPALATQAEPLLYLLLGRCTQQLAVAAAAILAKRASAAAAAAEVRAPAPLRRLVRRHFLGGCFGILCQPGVTQARLIQLEVPVGG